MKVMELSKEEKMLPGQVFCTECAREPVVRVRIKDGLGATYVHLCKAHLAQSKRSFERAEGD